MLLKLSFFLLLFVIVFNCIEVIKIKSKTEILILMTMTMITIVLKNNNQNVLELFTAPMNHTMGPYSGLKLDPSTLNARRKLIPSDPSIYKNHKNMKSNCGWMKQPCDAPLYKNVNIHNPIGEPVQLKDDINSQKLPTLDGTKNTKNKMFMFAYNQCRPECCPSTYSCDKGCVCTTKQQRQFINSRGSNRIPTYPGI